MSRIQPHEAFMCNVYLSEHWYNNGPSMLRYYPLILIFKLIRLKGLVVFSWSKAFTEKFKYHLLYNEYFHTSYNIFLSS